jgi:phage/plasmid primase-like uncharacterized protein
VNILSKLESEINYKYQEDISKEITFDNKCIRLGKKDHIWIYAHEWNYKGNMYQEITYGSWKYGDKNSIKSWDSTLSKDKNFNKAYKKKTVEARAKIDLDQKKRQKDCKDKWGKIWKKCKTAKDHDYLQYKGVSAYGLRVDRNGVLLIPAKDINGMNGVQRIFKDPETGNMVKKFSAGIKIQGSIHALKPLKDQEFCFLSEGYATAATIQDLFPEIPSVCCFNASNLPRAVETIRSVYPDIKIIIAADNDHAVTKPVKNPGLKYARQTVHRFRQVIYKYPEFKTVNPDWTDFNDLAEFESKEKAKEQLEFEAEEFAQLECLGHNDGTYFYISSENQQIVSLSWANHNKQGLRRLFANKAFWLKNYGVELEDGDLKTSWDWACEDLMEKCHKKGIFDPTQVRGIGVWIDGDKYCINDGESVYNNNPTSVYNYQKTVKIDYSLKPSNHQNMLNLLSAFKNLEYKNKNDYFYLAAWYIQAQIFPVLPWRFHIWLTGSAGTGKSTILKWLHSLSMNNILTNNTTAAGVRQKVKSNACSVIYDEAESTEERTKGVIALAREMSSNGEFEALRGTVTGNALNYNTQCVFCFGSVQIDLEKQTDRSRIFTIEMNETKDQDENIFAGICEVFEYFIKNKNQVFTFIYNSIDKIIYNYNFCKAHLKRDYKLESRLADQLAMAMACYNIYFSDEKMDYDQYKSIVKTHNLIESEYTEINDEKEHELCYDALMSVIVDSYTNTTVAQAIHQIRYMDTETEMYDKMLGVHGLRFFTDGNILFVPSKNTHLKKKLPDYTDISRVLKRDREILVKDKARVRITQIGNVRGIKIKVKL